MVPWSLSESLNIFCSTPKKSPAGDIADNMGTNDDLTNQMRGSRWGQNWLHALFPFQIWEWDTWSLSESLNIFWSTPKKSPAGDIADNMGTNDDLTNQMRGSRCNMALYPIDPWKQLGTELIACFVSLSSRIMWSEYICHGTYVFHVMSVSLFLCCRGPVFY